MYISLVRMPVDGLKFEHKYQEGELDTSGFEFEFIETPSLIGRIDPVGTDMRLRSDIRARLKAPCDRCLKDVEIDIKMPVDLLYSREDPGSGKSGEIELHSQDLYFDIYQNDQIDLDAMVLEQLELSIPIRVLCREECRGLCPQCGTDLNIEQCNCTKPVDPRWQALADIKEKLS
ncbi:MAG: DUF177 domain-containing protein [Acidobacteria bacterium]|nr:DUF177 domain-containing protein [Acidobacteriota bacterium]